MAVINGLKAVLSKFTVNGLDRPFVDCINPYGTADVLNGGETCDFSETPSKQNLLSYTFRITGLNGHIVKNVTIKSLLLKSDGTLSTSKNFMLSLNGVTQNSTLTTSDSVKTLVPTKFATPQATIEGDYELTLEVLNTSAESCYYGLQNIVIDLQDITYSISLTFTGPNKSRVLGSIQVATLLVNRDSTSVTFTHDSTSDFNNTTDNVEGRIYFRKDGIYVDGYQYGVNTNATEYKQGLVKIKNQFEKDQDGNIIAPTDQGVVPTLELVYNLIQDISNGVISLPTASTEIQGTVKLSSSSFEVDEDGGLIIPTSGGVAATPQLVFNTLVTAKNYIDEQLSGIKAPVDLKIEDDKEQIQEITEEMIFSNDFELRDNKLFINWLEII